MPQRAPDWPWIRVRNSANAETHHPWNQVAMKDETAAKADGFRPLWQLRCDQGNPRLELEEERRHMELAYIVTSAAGSNRDHTKGTREQPYWDEHASFIDHLVEESFIILGGPLPDEGGAVLVVRAGSEAEVRDRLATDPWFEYEILVPQSIRRWEIFIDRRAATGL